MCRLELIIALACRGRLKFTQCTRSRTSTGSAAQAHSATQERGKEAGGGRCGWRQERRRVGAVSRTVDTRRGEARRVMGSDVSWVCGVRV